ncbi:aldo/keto reductase [Aquipuribacter sp. SD81]|uniref:aldo/keto reductase n=1 Tax=Aquipuribacter sp. SD81 TaxID=3127703 RepID=UPI00301729E2
MSDVSTRRLGDRQVFPVGLGAMPLSSADLVQDRDRAVATVHAALDAGVTHVDTALIYAPSPDQAGHNEALVAEALRTWGGDASQVLVASKAGLRAGPDGVVRDASRDGLRRMCEQSLAALGRDQVDVYYLHRHDPALPYAEQVANLLALRDAGLVRQVAVSNVTPEMLEVALDVAGGPDDGGVVAVQNEFSPRFRRDPGVMTTCEERGIAFVPWSPFGGASQAAEVGSRYAPFAEVAEAHGVSAHQVALAWLRALSPAVVPIPGSSRPATIEDSVGAARLALTPEDVERLSATRPEGSSQFPDDEPAPPLR